jgi:hypothetical protein
MQNPAEAPQLGEMHEGDGANEKFRQRLLGCAICGARDPWWMTTDEQWALVPKQFRRKVLCRQCFAVFITRKGVITFQNRS